jgi:hypothetical protein
MRNAEMEITIDMYSTTTKTSKSRLLKPEEYFDKKTLVSGEEAVFGVCREWEIYALFKDFEQFDLFTISITDANFSLTYVQKITYWNAFQNKLHLCHLFKENVEQMKERQMILTQSFENKKYLTNRFRWESDTWFPEGHAILRSDE